ncbi:L-aspartate oxidase [Bifidobacterium merycicum]|uniref:L-aspartate oxidase n=1 Tax=Bifidobacterium merycicum TaxID=78345 RepID=UPI000D1A6EE5|nr:FAD-binding protein [Bifidobacterium merycicum]
MIVVIGAGIAGLSAALAAAGDKRVGAEGLTAYGNANIAGGDASDDVLLVCKDEFVESNTYHAQGGVACAIFSDDDPRLHAEDTMAAGHGLCDRTAVDVLTDEGARHVRELIAAGWHVDRGEDGSVLRGLEAAHCRSRVVHAGGDATGKVLELDVSAMVRENPRIHVLEHAFLNDLIMRDGHVSGVRLTVRGADGEAESRTIDATRVILATGGAGRLYPYTTNPAVATGDGLAAALRAGAQVTDLEFYQFHPTAMAIGEHFLVSEAVRGEGAVLLDEHGHRFMTDVDPRAELAPRDVVACANFRTMQAQGGKPVMLDVSPMAKENPDLAAFLRHRFPTIDAYTRSLGFDWSKEPIPVAPAAHYWMGGIRTDLFGRSSIPGLYAAGECARTGVQGANRLASNSLLEGLVYGYRAGLATVRDADDAVWQPQTLDNSAITGLPVAQEPMVLDMPGHDGGNADGDGAGASVWDRGRIENEMWKHVGVLRDHDGLAAAVTDLAGALAEANAAVPAAVPSAVHGSGVSGAASYADRIAMLENRNLLTVGYVEAVAALNRCESRGAHTRTDYATVNPTIAHSIAYRLKGTSC